MKTRFCQRTGAAATGRAPKTEATEDREDHPFFRSIHIRDRLFLRSEGSPWVCFPVKNALQRSKWDCHSFPQGFTGCSSPTSPPVQRLGVDRSRAPRSRAGSTHPAFVHLRATLPTHHRPRDTTCLGNSIRLGRGRPHSEIPTAFLPADVQGHKR